MMEGPGCEVPAFAGTTVGFAGTTYATNVRAGAGTAQWAFVVGWGVRWGCERLDHYQGFFHRLSDGDQRYAFVQGDKPSSVGNGKSQKVDIRNLARTRQIPAVYHGIVQQADIVGDKLVVGGGYSGAQSLRGSTRLMPMRVTGIRFAADGDLEDVVVAVAVGLCAKGEDTPILLLARIASVLAVGGPEIGRSLRWLT